MKFRVVSAEKIRDGNGDSALLLIEISGISDWDSAETAEKLARLIQSMKKVCQEQLRS